MSISPSAFGQTLDRFSAVISQGPRAEVAPRLNEVQTVRRGADIAAPSMGELTRGADMLAPPTHGDETRCDAPRGVCAKTPRAKRESIRRVLDIDLKALAAASPDTVLAEARMHSALGAYLGMQDGVLHKSRGGR